LFEQFFHPGSTDVLTTNNRTNILILGIGGAGHEGSLLTDSMLFVSIPHSSSPIVSISLPRDIWISSTKSKVNALFYYGGFPLVGREVSILVGEPIHYYVLLDFSSFRKIITLLGGIDVSVSQGFTDTQFPIEGKENDLCNGDLTYACRYETISFAPGIVHMDGDTALKYVRSRHSVGDEGTDFSRGRRQQEVIAALMEKFFSFQTLQKSEVLLELRDVLSESLVSTIPTSSYPVLARFAFDSRLQYTPLSFPEDMLFAPKNTSPYGNQYVLIPKSGNWDFLHQFLRSHF
jgi:LCP family protein required for cell wall assembly